MQWFGFLTSGFVSVRISLESGENGELGWLNRRVYFYETKLKKVNNEWIFVCFFFWNVVCKVEARERYFGFGGPVGTREQP